MVVRLLVGGVLLVLGRKLFWLFVAAVGFAAGWAVSANLLHVQPEWLALLIALVAGVLGALLAQFVQRMAIGLAGFLAGGYLAISLVSLLQLQGSLWGWLAFLGGGILGAVLLAASFEWALIGLSSLAGAMLVTGALKLSSTMHLLVLAGLFVLGVIIQSALGGSKSRPSTS
ncbi:MAG: TMEM198/TM7SF3 family protein [Anaerolineales bacterium]|nr:TMEM198/TM7SF3 family protein [Anaerolineales bacterium]